jgi:large subunit ribosomal protein MRP49
MLPRLKYHNPAVRMTVSRSAEQSKPAIFSIYFRQPEGPNQAQQLPSSKSHDVVSSSEEARSATTTPFKPLERGDGVVKYVIDKNTPGANPTLPEEIVTINMKHRNEEDILKEFMAITKAVQVEPTPGELETLQELADLDERSRIDHAKNQEVKDAIKREQNMLKQARGEMV